MPFWRVDVGGVTHRYVSAETRREAEEAVVTSRIASLDVRASPAGVALTRAYESSGPVRRKGMLARLDGLTNPRERASSKSARRRLARLIRFEMQERAWVEEQHWASPPLSPGVIDDLVRLQAVVHVEKNFDRLPEWGRHSPVHGE
jgi:hypothetical protein